MVSDSKLYIKFGNRFPIPYFCLNIAAMINYMKPSLRKLPSSAHCSFSVKVDAGENLLNNWHYHPEVELILLKRSAGTRIIGNSIDRFGHNDLLCIGKNVPHAFVHEEQYLTGSASPEAVVIQFYETFLGREFMNLPELRGIQDVFVAARQGLSILSPARQQIIPLMEKMLQASSFDRILLLLEILRVLLDRNAYAVLVEEGFIYDSAKDEDGRIKKIIDYTAQNYHQNIRIESIASIVNLTKESFCRFFKSHTGKTYFEFLIEYRINQACRMLVENHKSIKEIGYCCGYDNLSNFYSQFKKVIRQSPLEYKKKCLNITEQTMY